MNNAYIPMKGLSSVKVWAMGKLPQYGKAWENRWQLDMEHDK